jgi:hypothetical protein
MYILKKELVMVLLASYSTEPLSWDSRLRSPIELETESTQGDEVLKRARARRPEGSVLVKLEVVAGDQPVTVWAITPTKSAIGEWQEPAASKYFRLD